ncbi:MAG: extracellular solute-binding protein [Methylacidiphilales bacterium]|nr:extracellular solute-binding protein [Candidatus Methylacidiphilales bacterium]
MPKKKVAIFFLLALLGAALFIYFTFPRTKDEIPKSNNQQPFPSTPEPGPNGLPVPETVPHPNTPKVPPGPSLHVMAWASGNDATVLEAEADDFTNGTGRRALLTIDPDEATYRRDLHDAFASGTPPDVCLIGSRDFSGLDPERDLAEGAPNPDTAARSIAAFTVNGRIRAVPDEFSVDVLFYNELHFDRAGIGYPDQHWTWDVMEEIARAMGSLQMKNDAGQPIYPLELPADFDFWNILCTETGHPALDLGEWHISDHDTRESQLHALEWIHTFFCDLTVTAPPTKPGQMPGALFAQQRSSLLIAPSDFAASLPKFRYAFTLIPTDFTRASLARVNGWAVAAKSSDPAAAHLLAGYLACQPVHAGWTRVQKPPEDAGDTPEAICHEALDHALLPRIEPGTAKLAQFLDEQINLLAQNSAQTTDALYAGIQARYQKSPAQHPFENSLPQPEGLNPRADASSPLRDF